MPAFHTPTETPLELRQLIVPLVLLTACAIFVVRLWQIQIVQGEEYRDKARRAGEIQINTLAPRGEIYDRSGHLLAGVKSAWVVRATPSIVKKHPESLEHAERILGISAEEIQEKLKSAEVKTLPTDILIDATAAQAIKVAEQPSLLPGFDVQVRSIRKIVEPFAVTHVLGYVGRPSEVILKQLKEQGIKAAEYVGRDGLEKIYEADLMGKEGASKMAVDSRGRPVQQMSSQNPIPGARLYLGLDLDLQREALRLLGSKKGAVAALDPTTGDVLAFVSSPTYDLSLFEGGISNSKFRQLRDDPANPFQRRPSQGLYSPGSTFKIVTALAAARAGHLRGHNEFCPGFKKIGTRSIKCRNHAPGVTHSFASAFRTSCNTYFIDLALLVGPEALSQAAHDLGLGEKTGIDLPSEWSGMIPDGLEVKEMGNKVRPWYQGDTANMGIGQGGVLVTPLQMAQLMMRVANQGAAPIPRLVRARQATDQLEPEQIAVKYSEEFSAPPEYWEMLREAMGTVVASGTARKAQIDGLQWGGKTGSTQHSGGSKPHSWFVGMAPLNNPKIVIAVLAEESGGGGDIAAPIAAGVVRKYLESLENQRPNSSEAAEMASRARVKASSPL